MKKLLGLFLLLTITIASCTTGEIPVPTKQMDIPVLPPEASMAPDLNIFETAESEMTRTEMGSNWAYAALNIGVYSGVLYQHLIVPISAYKAVLSTEPMIDREAKIWVWKKAFTIADKGSYEIQLTASIWDESVSWMGYISSEGGDDLFVWFRGVSNFQGEEGYWEVYESPESPAVWLSNTWELDKETGNTTVTYTMQKDGDYEGSSFIYQENQSSDLNKKVILSNAYSESDVSISWNSTAKYGRVKSESFFGDSQYHCWDQNLANTNCEN
ncbi:hypothetical protein [Echinicola vietnamensis]|uniref:Lipoprotein n=1 Tax=Echinicola vietnamensis (strain DSM 17526 / LMG 23754 / KMM 6221) TaxID=926556 RepID=L0FW59_ECHVK|nr:hypothetical protein [Echinicola vietnamensis]AGA77278.1 hypothetical protein Echvi_1007 [Echinicola vietnamensis DSM 17526]